MASARGGRKPFNEAGLEAGFEQDVKNVGSGKGAYAIFAGLPKGEWLKIQDGIDYSFRFLSWYAHDDEKKPSWYLKQDVHKYVGPPGNGRDYACRMNIGDTNCLCCREIPDKKAGSRYYYNLQVKEGRNTEWKNYYFEANYSVHNEFVKAGIKTNPDTGEKVRTFFMSPTKGCTVGFTGAEIRKGKGKWISPSAIGFGTPSALSEADLDKAVDLHSFVHIFENDELLSALDGNHPTIKSEDTPPASEKSVPTEVVEREVVAEAVPEEATPEPPQRRRVVEEPAAPEAGAQPKLCSMGLVFGDPSICGKQVACDKCPDAEYKECANLAGAK